MKMTNQPRVPHNLNKGDRVKFSVTYDGEPKYGTIIDILSTQFLIEDDERTTYITSFNNVLPLIHTVIP